MEMNITAGLFNYSYNCMNTLISVCIHILYGDCCFHRIQIQYFNQERVVFGTDIELNPNRY